MAPALNLINFSSVTFSLKISDDRTFPQPCVDRLPIVCAEGSRSRSPLVRVETLHLRILYHDTDIVLDTDSRGYTRGTLASRSLVGHLRDLRLFQAELFHVEGIRSRIHAAIDPPAWPLLLRLTMGVVKFARGQYRTIAFVGLVPM